MKLDWKLSNTFFTFILISGLSCVNQIIYFMTIQCSSGAHKLSNFYPLFDYIGCNLWFVTQHFKEN
jgi:hypothetical protein